MKPLGILERDRLESLIDAHSVKDVLEALSIICSEKADHIRDTYQDNATAKPWRKASNDIETVALRTAI